LRALDRERFESRIACFKRWGQFLVDIEQQQIPISEYFINSLYKPATFRRQMQFIRDLKRNHVQIVHSYNFYANLFAIPAARLAGVPVVIASIRDTGMNLTPAKIHVHRLFCGLADCILVNAEAIRRWLAEQGCDEEKIVVIRNGLDLSRFDQPVDGAGLRRELGISEAAPLVMVLARLTPQKGIEFFLQAAALVSRHFPEARFLIIGDAFLNTRRNGVAERDIVYTESLKQLAVRLGIGERVIFTGFRPDIPALLSQAAVSVLPSLSGEGLPNSLIESMAAGVPVVATRVGGTTEVIERDGEDGLLVAPQDPAALAGAIETILVNRELARYLGQEGKRRAIQRFSLERMVHRTEELYASLLEQVMRGKNSRNPKTGPEVLL
jgi:glycosyltransferase involved in cell wall biosynthesis